MEDEEFFCDTCDRLFKSKYLLDEHINEHTTCGREGCVFTAHPKVVAKHVEMQHKSGLFNKIGNLYTPEAIAKWIAERKKSYPTKLHVEQKKLEQEEKFARGERLVEDNRRFNRSAQAHKRDGNQHNNKRGRGSRNQRRRRDLKMKEEEEDEDDKAEWRGNIPPFPGIAAFQVCELEPEETKVSDQKKDEFSDLEWEASSTFVESTPLVTTSTNFSKALNSLMSLYGSDQSCSEDDSPPVVLPILKEKDKELDQEKQPVQVITSQPKSDESGPEEVSICYKSLDAEILPKVNSQQQQQKQQNDQNVQGGSRKRKRHHKTKNVNESKNEVHNASNNNQNKNRFVKEVRHHYTPRRRLTLLEKLLNREIRHERNVILQCVRYVVQRNFFDIGELSTSSCLNSSSGSSIVNNNSVLNPVRKFNNLKQCIHYIIQNNFFDRDLSYDPIHSVCGSRSNESVT